MRVGRARLNVADGVPAAWVEKLVKEVAAKKVSGRILKEMVRYPAPPGWSGETVLKVYGRRPKHNLVRLLSVSRVTLEGAGYMAFMERGLSVPKLVLWGEARRFRLFEFGILMTVRIDAPSVAEAYAATRESELLFAMAEELGVIHKAGLAHGDPFARNFLATRPRPTPLDFASWRPLEKATQAKDLTRFACSMLKLTDNVEQTAELLRHYERSGVTLPVSTDDLIERAIAYSKKKVIRA